jgi:hypothetical protein
MLPMPRGILKLLAQLQAQMESEREKLENSKRQNEVTLTQKHTQELARLNLEIEKLRSRSL